MSEIKLKKIVLDFEFENNDKISFLLAQLHNNLKRRSDGYFISNSDEKSQIIMKILESSLNCKYNYFLDKIDFIIFPEVSIPIECFDKIKIFSEQKLKKNTILLFGLEYIDIKKYKEILEKSNNDDKNVDDIKYNKANIAVIIIKDKNGSVQYYVQSKIEFSDIEKKFSRINKGESILIFELKDGVKTISFTQLICFDFICSYNKKKIIKFLGEKISEDILYSYNLDFVFNIQHNPKPFHDEFKKSIALLFNDTESKICKDKCALFFVNSANKNYYTKSEEEYGYSSIYTNKCFYKKSSDIHTFKMTVENDYLKLLFRENGSGLYSFLFKPLKYVNTINPDDTKPFEQWGFSKIKYD